jgi:hypothetical protein
MRYILAYFALMLGLSGLSLLWAGKAYGFVLLLSAAALIWVLVRMERMRRRERRCGGYGAAIEGYELRFSDEQLALEAKLPQDELDNPAMLELLSAYENDPDETEAIRRLYEQLGQRFSDWCDEFARLHALNESGAVGLPEKFAERYDALDRQLTHLLDDVKRLEARAVKIGRELEDPLDHIAEGALMLESAEASCARRFGSKIPEELAATLKLARQRLAEARGAIAAGAERPLDAVRLAQEVCALARAVQLRI